MAIIGTVKNLIGKIIYGMLGIGILIYTLCHFKPGHETTDDFVFFGMLLTMGLLTFPISIIAVPLVFVLSLGINTVLFCIMGLFVDTPELGSDTARLNVFSTWFGIFICGYSQWFWFPRWVDKRLSKNRTTQT